MSNKKIVEAWRNYVQKNKNELDENAFKLLVNFTPTYLRYEEKWDEYSFIVEYNDDEYFLGFTPDFPEPKISSINKGDYYGVKIENHFKENGISEVIFYFCRDAHLKKEVYIDIDE